MLNVRTSTPNYMIYGETGLKPLVHTIDKRMILFWKKIITGNSEKLSSKFYHLLLNDHVQGIAEYTWITKIKNILNENGFSYIWLLQTCTTANMKMIKQRIQDQSIQILISSANLSNKGKSYEYLKLGRWNLEYYLTCLDKKVQCH